MREVPLAELEAAYSGYAVLIGGWYAWKALKPAQQKIFHASEYDIICLKRDYGFQFANLFDTMIAAFLLNSSSLRAVTFFIDAEQIG